MSKYNFNIDNYHAIGHADIEIEGITVIVGSNGCGKSTMSRWLYYIVNTLSVLDSFFFSDFRDMVIKSLEKYSNALDDISNYLDDDKVSIKLSEPRYSSRVTIPIWFLPSDIYQRKWEY